MSAPITFSVEDLKTPDRLERVLRQFAQAITGEAPSTPAVPDLNALTALLAPRIRDQLQSPGATPLNLQSLLPAQGQSVVLEDTHANRLTVYPATNYSVGTVFYETDRTVIYVVVNSSGALVWQYLDAFMYATFANRPTDLGTNDAGFLLIVSDHLHTCRWTGSAWVILDNDAGIFVDSAVALGTGYQLCDGTATTYLAISGADLAQTAFTTPDENTAPAGVYHKSIAAYTGVLNAAVAPVFTGTAATLTGNVSAPTFTGAAATLTGSISTPTFTGVAAGLVANTALGADNAVAHPYTPTGTISTPTLTMDSYTPTGSNSAPTLTMNSYTPAGTVAATAQPRNMGVLRYFRR